MNIISVAPMLKYTNRHFRYLVRLITKKTLLYTEMVSDSAIINTKDINKLLGFSPFEKPLSLQLGTGNHHETAKAMLLCKNFDYDEYNLNCGCPSERVKHNDFGAILMNNPDKVISILKAMQDNTSKPIALKHRIGITGFGINKVEYSDLYHFVEKISKAVDLKRYTIHSRIAMLEGLSPDENRTIPPLRYNDVYQIKKDFPHLTIEINGNIKTYDAIATHLKHVDAVMIGRLCKDNPYFFSKIDSMFYDSNLPIPSRRDVLFGYLDYIKNENKQRPDDENRWVLNPILELFYEVKGSKKFKQEMSKRITSNLYDFTCSAVEKSDILNSI